MDNLPPDFFRDMKTQDTAGDKAWRMTGLVVWGLIVFGFVASVPPLGVPLVVLTIIARIWLGGRREKRYARNAAKIALLHNGGQA